MSNLQYSGVNIDAKALEEQREEFKKPNTEFQEKRFKFDVKNYLNLQMKEDETTKTVKVRFLPVSPTEGVPFLKIITHALKVRKEIAQSGFKTYVCLKDEKIGYEGECPICKKSKELYEAASKAKKEGNEKLATTLTESARQFRSKITYIVRVIDRDHEDEGVKFWRFNANSKGEGIYDKLMALHDTRKAEAEEEGEQNYSIFDLYNGKDIIITINKSKIPDGYGGMKEVTSYNITDSGNRKPLSKDVELANKWINDPKTWKDVYGQKSADYLELVAENKVPVYDTQLGKFVEKKEFDKETKIMEEQAASEVLDANYNSNSKVVDANVGNTQNEDDDLPF